MKASKALLMIVIFGFGSIGFQSGVVAIEGNSSLEILPLDETYPRLYTVNNLDFGRHNLNTGQSEIHPKEDLTIKILDSRLVPTTWELQVQMTPMKNGSDELLTDTIVSLGKGNVTLEEGTEVHPVTFKENLEDSDFKTILRSKNYETHGWISYTIAKEDIKLVFNNQNNVVGKYRATNNWRFVNAKF